MKILTMQIVVVHDYGISSEVINKIHLCEKLVGASWKGWLETCYLLYYYYSIMGVLVKAR